MFEIKKTSGNIMGEILISRYEVFTKYQKSVGIHRRNRTHITTNLNANELEQKYGERVRSRLREMVTVIAFDKTSSDKRK